jgi:hypothetical protein
MKTNLEIHPAIPREVIDPATQRRCALQSDIARALGITPSAVAVCGARIHQDRYVDLLDVIQARGRVRRRGRPKSNQTDVNRNSLPTP